VPERLHGPLTHDACAKVGAPDLSVCRAHTRTCKQQHDHPSARPPHVGLMLHVHVAQGLTLKIHEACAAEGVRAIVSRGWGGLGELPDGAAARADVFAIGSVPHDWLFPQCSGAAPGAAQCSCMALSACYSVNVSICCTCLQRGLEAVRSGVCQHSRRGLLLHGEQAQAGNGNCLMLRAGVVHHGGAGTTASGLLGGCPTTVVYIFGALPASRRSSAAPSSAFPQCAVGRLMHSQEEQLCLAIPAVPKILKLFLVIPCL